MAVGAQGYPAGGDRGAVYLYVLRNGLPQLVGRICNGCRGPRDIDVPLAEDDWFGVSVAIDGRRLVVGAWGDDGAGIDTPAADWGVTWSKGAAWLFIFEGDDWSGGSLAGVIGDGYRGERDINLPLEPTAFGWDLDLQGNELIVRSSYDSERRGAAYMFLFDDLEFSGGRLQGVIGHERRGSGDFHVDLEPDDAFAHALDLSGTRLIIGADKDDGYGNVGAHMGALYAFDISPGFATITPRWIIGHGYTGGENLSIELDNNDYFALQAEIDGRRFAVGASADDGFGNVSSGTGAVRIFECADEALHHCTVRSTVGLGYTGTHDVNVADLQRFDYFSYSLAYNEGRLLVGSPFSPWGEPANRCTSCRGNVRLFQRLP